MSEIVGILVLSIVNESTVEYLFNWVPTKYKIYVSLSTGILLAFGFNSNICNILGLIPVYPAVGTFFTGLLIGRGANVINDLIELVTAMKKDFQLRNGNNP